MCVNALQLLPLSLHLHMLRATNDSRGDEEKKTPSILSRTSRVSRAKLCTICFAQVYLFFLLPRAFWSSLHALSTNNFKCVLGRLRCGARDEPALLISDYRNPGSERRLRNFAETAMKLLHIVASGLHAFFVVVV